ncbi:DUF4229 domain-containing protein [Frigoribacterium sp. CFBP 13729]|uniref:DUF4229 domain-containing protein n=1 Tax=Frigoribacterium sp. CFBP 13729 TaxID=2775293 RepID=UPI00177A8757|nr:DUF4229 domain-containing protein [Frigoribacterium sp. CFBP 13729]
MKPWVKYTIVRLGVFLVALVVLVLLLPNPYLATLIAAVVAFCVSYLFFAPLRRQVALELAERRSKPEPLDGDSLAEDAELAERDAREAGTGTASDDAVARDQRDAGRAS